MSLYQPVVPARYTQRLMQLVQDQDPVAIATLLAHAGVDVASLDDPEFPLDFSRFSALFTGLRELSGRSDLGFRLGQAIGGDAHGPLGLALHRCATVGELLQMAARHARLLTPSLSLHYRREGRSGELLCRPAAGMSSDMLQAFYEIHVVSLHRLLQERLGSRLPPYRCWIPMPRPQHAARYRELGRLQVQFAARPLPEVRTLFDAALLDLSLDADEQRAGAAPAAAELQALQLGLDRSHQYCDWVRLMLREAEGHQPSQVQLAKLLNVSAHTLARHLRQEGQGFRQIAGDVRHQRAGSLLRGSTLSVDQIAQRLGYRDLSNFIHAFRRREGLSPARYRRCAGSEPPDGNPPK